MSLRFLSICSGIEAASVAWHPLGWKPLAFSEIEPFPRAVLAHHYPDVPLHGDFTKLRDMPFIEDADVLVGGTPCQAFSVAGLRNSLADDRGNLSLEYVRLADAIDVSRLSAGKQPAIIVWENVPGVLSVKDNAFGCFLAGLAGDVTPYDPPRGKWTNAGVVAGPQRAVAWRVLDAQYFGLAQRRRRVFVVASAREGFDPAAVLLEFEGVRRDTPPRREAGKVAPTIPSRSTAGGGLGTDFDLDGGVISTGDTRGQDPVVAVIEDPVPPLMARSSRGGAQTLSPGYQTDGHMVAVEQPYQVGNTLTARMHKGINTTLDEGQTPVLAHALRGEGFDASEAGPGRGTPIVPVAFHPTQDPISSTDGSTHALGCGSSVGQASIAVAVSLRGREGGGTAELGDEVQNCLRASSGGGDKPHVLAHMAVRRLTPVECERLQGFPDGYTMIPWKKKPAAECPDGPRYKALGNSMAVPVMRWIGTRIAEALK